MTRDPRPYWIHSDPNAPTAFAYCVVCTEREAHGYSLMCGACFNKLRADITVLVGAYIWLGIAMISTGGQRGETVSRQPAGSRMPYRADLHDARDDIAGKLKSWARDIAEKHVPALRGPADADVETVARWLRMQLPWVSEQDWCTVMATELAETAHAAYGLVPWNRRRSDFPLPCPGCGYLTLSLYGGDEVIMCRNRSCAKALTWPDYWAAVKEQQPDAFPPPLKATPPENNPSTSMEAA